MLKKVIDKVFNPGYNTHTGLEVSNRDEYTFDKAITDRVFDNINTLDTALQEATANTDVTYLIAGGAVRDGLLGLAPKDYDIFLDLSKTAEMEDEERDDLIALLNYNFHDKVRMDLFRHNFEIPWQVHDEAYKDMENTFVVYEHMFQGRGHHADNVILERDDTYQLIYRKNNPEIAFDPLSFVINNFDWSLTKAYYKDGKVFVGQQFADTMKTKRIESTDLETSRRIRSWFNRNVTTRGLNFVLKIEPEPTADTSTLKISRTIRARDGRVLHQPNLIAIDEWPRVQEVAQRLEIVNNIVNNPAAEIANEIQQLNDAHRAELDRQFWNGIQWRAVDANENQAQVAPAVPEV